QRNSEPGLRLRNIMTKFVVASLLLLSLAACGPEPDTPLGTIVTDGQYRVTRVGVFRDELAYDGKRGIYEIRDVETGKKYVGISGIGISEVAAHQAGKSSKPDER
ncbi:TPA: hypothetical protein ACP7Q5_004842, partial [Escherichia coli]